MIKTSIIIPTYNQVESLLETMKSFQSQIRNKQEFEIVICDDNSSDGTGDRLRKLRCPIFLKYLINNPPLGRAKNRNFGFDNSSGDRVIFIDGDMIPGPGFIKAMLQADCNDSVIVGGIKPHPDISMGHFEKYLYSRGLYRFKRKGEVLPGKMFASGNFMMKRALYKQVGGFDPQFDRWGGEDIDLGLRLEDMGINVVSEPGALTYHNHLKTLDQMASDFYDFGRNTFCILLRKHPRFAAEFSLHKIGIFDNATAVHPLFKLLSPFAISPAMLGSMKKIVSSFDNHPWPDVVYSYLIWGHLGLGYKRWKNEHA